MEGRIVFTSTGLQIHSLPPPALKLHLLLGFSLPVCKLPHSSVRHLYGPICCFHLPDPLVCFGGESL